MIPLGPGRIFWAVYAGPRGSGKPRPMVVTNRSTDLVQTGQVFAVVCSTTFDEPIQPDEVRLPFSPDGRCVTKLREDRVAVYNWTTPFAVADILESDMGGLVPSELLREICGQAGIILTPER